MEDAVQTAMTQCELWTDNADMEEAEHRGEEYFFHPEKHLSMVAEDTVSYGSEN